MNIKLGMFLLALTYFVGLIFIAGDDNAMEFKILGTIWFVGALLADDKMRKK